MSYKNYLAIENEELGMKNEITAYSNDFENVVLMIKQAQIRAHSSINRELIDLYFSVGKYISEKVSESEWGKSVVKQLAEYILKSNPNQLSTSNTLCANAWSLNTISMW